MKKTIFDVLTEKNICYMVVGSRGYFSPVLTYTIEIKTKDKERLNDTGIKNRFVKNDAIDKYGEYHEHDSKTSAALMSENEIRIFKKKILEYDCVYHALDGKIYEIKGNSFKKYHEAVLLAEEEERKLKENESKMKIKKTKNENN